MSFVDTEWFEVEDGDAESVSAVRKSEYDFSDYLLEGDLWDRTALLCRLEQAYREGLL